MTDVPSWNLRFEDKKFIFFSSDNPDAPDEQVAVEDIPAVIYETGRFFGVSTFDKQQVEADINSYALKLAENLASYPFFNNRWEWGHWLSDQTQTRNCNEWLDLAPVGEACRKQSRTVITQMEFALSYLFWKGMFYYLRRDERWRTENASFLYLVSTWQSFSLARALAEMWLPAQPKPKDQNASHVRQYSLRWLNNELIEVTRSLDAMLKDPGFRYPIEILLSRMKTPVKDEPSKGTLQPLATSEERLFYGMALAGHNPQRNAGERWQSEKAFSFIGGDKPIYNPAQMDSTWNYGQVISSQVVTTSFDWNAEHIHPVYQEAKDLGLQSFIRKLIAGWLLPRYDFQGAFHLARLLRKDPAGKQKPPVTIKQILLWLTAVAVVMLLLGQLPLLIDSLAAAVRPNLENTFAVFLEAGIVLALLFIPGWYLIANRLDAQVVPYLMLPRLLGGILVGYTAILLEGDSLTLKNTLFADGSLGWLRVVLLVAGVWAVGLLYFYYEALARVRDKQIAIRRARTLFIITLLASALIGLFVVPLTTAMEWGSQACENASLFSCKMQGPFLIGPIGVIDLRQMFVFMSLAMLTGLVSQFIFEEKPITASIWEEK